MKVLLDECVPRKLCKHLTGHECVTVSDAGLAGTKNGELLSAAERSGFDLFLTVDQGVAYQQNLTQRTIAILLLQPEINRLADLLPLVPECLAQMQDIAPRRITNGSPLNGRSRRISPPPVYPSFSHNPASCSRTLAHTVSSESDCRAGTTGRDRAASESACRNLA